MSASVSPESPAPPKKLSCSFCGARVLPADEFCHNCGSELDFTAEKAIAEKAVAEKAAAEESVAAKTVKSKMFCTECGTENPREAKFCMNCGASINAVATLNAVKPVKSSKASAKSEAALVKTRQQIYISLGVAALAFALFAVAGWRGFASGAKGFDLSGAAGAGAEARPVQPNSNGRTPLGDAGDPTASPQNGMPQNPAQSGSTGSGESTSPAPAPLITADKAALDRIDTLRKQFEAAADAKRKLPFAGSLIGEYVQIGRLDLAGDYAKMFAELSVGENKPDAKLFLRAANLYDDGKAYEKAVTMYEKALELDSKNTDARVDLSICLLNAGQMRRSVEQMKQAVTENPTHQKANLNMGILNAQIGRTDDAKKFWEAALALDPNTEAGKRAKELLGKN
ncbi:MAG: zinc ribbon domain-containing protein [Rhizobacter sp.]|nr:zinc ribbon domain-containing protein [Chlorobiales bacterium]